MSQRREISEVVRRRASPKHTSQVLWPSKMMMYFSCHLLLEVYLCLESESVEAVILLLRISSLLNITFFLTNST